MSAHENRLSKKGTGPGWRLGLTHSGKVQNQPEALWLDPVSLATEPRPNFWTETRIGVSSPPGEYDLFTHGAPTGVEADRLV